MKTIKIVLIVIVVLVLGNWIYATLNESVDVKTVLSFEDCVKAGYPVMESYPRRCATPDGRTYTEELPEKITYVNATEDNIKVELPFPGAVTGKTFSVIGQARGPWFFEASFPIVLLDKDQKVIATSIATAEGEWMTTDFVPFRADIKVPESYMGESTLVLKKDNPSDLRENDAEISFPITVEY